MMNKKADNVIIGFGKAGKTLANYLGNKGEKTILVEKSPVMYGGTCINVGCIPSKFLATCADQRSLSESSDAEYYKNAVINKKGLIAKLNKANYDKLAGNKNVEVIDGLASFKDDHTIKIQTDREEYEVYAERVFINTGARPFIPEIEGLQVGKRIHTSETLMDLEEFPQTLTILGSGFIGLEFAASYAKFGAKVTIIDKGDKLLPREDDDVAKEVFASYQALGVDFIFNAEINQVEQDENAVKISYSANGEKGQISSAAFLVAAGRKANIEDLNLANAGVDISDRGFIQVNKHLQTNKAHIFAMGDVNGGPQFTYVSLDDYRIVKSYLEDQGTYSRDDRQTIAFSAFLHPTFSKAGLSEKDAIAKGYNIKTASLPVTAIPKAKILGNQTGIYKAVVDADSNQILGVVLFAEESHEVINIVVSAMMMKQPYTMLANQIFTHPTMSEALNDLFGLIK
ncbi:pyridine nucleotide-disulfide oxidoreductase [Lachnospiraceae bacterium oral taxon 500]|nr:pyridine nucleotide-disulfide oxidoreductase [Lachnospiraceae bacterium oral taxon 500]